MKLEVGMYVRIECVIAKILYIGDEFLECDKPIMKSFGQNYYSWDIDKLNIKKASHNIIDLIEVGDYVNGRKVIKNCLEDGGNIILFENGFCATNKDIKSIVTKEQFESMSYKVGD